MEIESHTISLDIIPIAMRPCRSFQERIADYTDDGRPRFAWDELRIYKMLRGDPRLDSICAECPFNIFQTPEGCKGTIFGMEIFLRVVSRLAPDSRWAQLTLDDDKPIPMLMTRVLAREFDDIERRFASSQWTVAQLFREDVPVMDYFDDGSYRPRLAPWNGLARPHLINSNEGYQIFLCAHGLIVKSNYDDPSPYVFTKLTRDSSGVFGTTAQGERVPFPMTMAHYPEWDSEQPRAFGELRMVQMNAAEVFRDTLDILAVFTTIATQAETGFIISPA